jgi:bifunctional UDP-N-acetylglucosamine pyrophosphorylase/glucosamine-1-phosphate N-acetyltransferase
MGINNRIELARASAAMRKRINDSHLLSGVTIIDPGATYIDSTVSIGKDATVYPGVILEGATTIGAAAVIEESVKITASTIGAGAVIKSRSVIESSEVGRRASIGPFARLRPGSVVSDLARVGNFVEVKNTTIGHGSKAGHLTYLGDAVIGKDVNIGAGTIICNYDGAKKHKTVIEDGAFIGSDTQLIAPVRIGKGAYVGSGSTITKNVPAGALAITRAEQRTIKGWAKKKTDKKPEGGKR